MRANGKWLNRKENISPNECPDRCPGVRADADHDRIAAAR
jgi:hypothetical protein